MHREVFDVECKHASERCGPDTMVRAGVTYRYVTDQLGSVRAVVDVATGAVVQAREYDAWGVVLYDTNPGFQPFGFAGGVTDGATGLVHFGARDYDPAVGRWISKDPSRWGGGENFYGYAHADPMNFIDIDGRNPIVAAGAVAGGAAAAAGQAVLGTIALDCLFNGCRGTATIIKFLSERLKPKAEVCEIPDVAPLPRPDPDELCRNVDFAPGIDIECIYECASDGARFSTFIFAHSNNNGRAAISERPSSGLRQRRPWLARPRRRLDVSGDDG
jgi:RHS repeat-associated protein